MKKANGNALMRLLAKALTSSEASNPGIQRAVEPRQQQEEQLKLEQTEREISDGDEWTSQGGSGTDEEAIEQIILDNYRRRQQNFAASEPETISELEMSRDNYRRGLQNFEASEHRGRQNFGPSEPESIYEETK